MSEVGLESLRVREHPWRRPVRLTAWLGALSTAGALVTGGVLVAGQGLAASGMVIRTADVMSAPAPAPVDILPDIEDGPAGTSVPDPATLQPPPKAPRLSRHHRAHVGSGPS